MRVIVETSDVEQQNKKIKNISYSTQSDIQKKMLIKELRKYLDEAEKNSTTYCELLMEIPELIRVFNCD